MADTLWTGLAATLGIPLWLLLLIALWSLIWKGCACWKAARQGQPVWFVALLIINTFGILEMLYLFIFSKIKLPNAPRKRTR